MATKSSNVNVKETYDGVFAGLPIVPGAAINEGDFLVWDPALNGGNGGCRVPAVLADIALANGGFVGTSRQQSPVASLNDNINNLDITKQGIVRVHSTPAETYKMFTPLYWNEAVDVQTVSTQNTGGRTQIGWAVIPQQLVMQGVLTVTGGASVDIQMILKPTFPAQIF